MRRESGLEPRMQTSSELEGVVITGSLMCTNLGVFAKDFGVEADPVVGHKHLALIQDVSLQSTRVACWQSYSPLAESQLPV